MSGCASLPERRRNISRAHPVVRHLTVAGTCVCLLAGVAVVAQPLAESHAEPEADVRAALALDGDAPSMAVTVAESKLSLRAQSVPLRDVLAEIGRQSGVAILLHGSYSDDITMEFGELSLEDGFDRLLGGYGRVFIYRSPVSDEVPVLERVIVLPGGRRVVPQAAPAGVEPSEAQTTQSRIRSLEAQLGRPEVQLAIESHLYAPDARARRDAFRDLMRTTDVEHFDALIALLRDPEVPISTWNEMLSPVREKMSWWDQLYLQVGLRRPPAKERFAQMLESYRLFKTREEANMP